MEPELGATGTGHPDELDIPLQRVGFAGRLAGLGVCRQVVAYTRKVKVGRMEENEGKFR